MYAHQNLSDMARVLILVMINPGGHKLDTGRKLCKVEKISLVALAMAK